MSSHPAHPHVAPGNGDVERSSGMRAKSLQRRGRVMAEPSILSAGKHGRLRPREQRPHRSAPEVDAAVHRVQKPATEPVLETSPADAERAKLPRGHHAVLPTGNAADHQIHMNYCRIDSLPGDVRQNCMTYVPL